VIEKYSKFFDSDKEPVKMPYGLKALWNKESSITYACAELRES